MFAVDHIPIVGAAFFQMLFDRPVTYFSIVFAVIVSIVLHELAHGWAAISQGDDTPIVKGHMTPNPMVHMGPVSIMLLMTCGLAWGLMPVNPLKFRSKYGDAIVAAAGPAMNLLLAVVAMIGYGLWVRFGGLHEAGADPPLLVNTQKLVWLFAEFNIVLLLLNLIPIPPLDGSVILGNFHRGYAQWIRGFRDPTVFMVALIVVIVGLSYTDFGLFDLANKAVLMVTRVISGEQLILIEQ